MANEEHLTILKQGVRRWNEWRKQHPDVQPDLSHTILNFSDLKHADLHFADLRGAHLQSAALYNTKLQSAMLYNTKLPYADLNLADLSNADLSYADLQNANLSEANLSGANLSYAFLWSTVFARTDLRNVKGLTELVHFGRSIVDLQTVQLPQDGSALHFLRGAGVAEEWIGFYRAQMMHPIQYHSCFVSYSSQDEPLARRLHTDLQDEGVLCWFAPHDLRPGQLIRKGIDEAIHMQDKLLLILSEHSVKSGWVSYEVETALSREIRQQREILFPIRIDDTIFQSTTSWAHELRDKRHIGDFRQWADPDHYQKVFQKLLRDLKAQV